MMINLIDFVDIIFLTHKHDKWFNLELKFYSQFEIYLSIQSR